MSYHFTRHPSDSGLDSYLKVEGISTNLPLYTDPTNGGFSVFVRFCAENVTDNHTIIKLNLANGDHFRLVASGNAANDPVKWLSVLGGVEKAATSAGAFTSGTWHCVVATVSMGISLSLDNATVNSNLKGASSGTLASFTVSSMGTYRAIAGDVAEVAIWVNTAFSLAALLPDAAALAKGVSPRTVRPSHLVHYWDLTRGLQDQIGGCTLTAFNDPTVSEHPRVIP